MAARTTPEIRAWMRDMRARGVQPATIARLTGYTYHTVRNHTDGVEAPPSPGCHQLQAIAGLRFRAERWDRFVRSVARYIPEAVR